MKHRRYQKFDVVGVGGRKCPCCYPGPGIRKTFIRAFKKRERLQAMKEALQDD